jgi:hypothetical protein
MAISMAGLTTVFVTVFTTASAACCVFSVVPVALQMSPDGITRHWKQFLQDVTGELLAAEEEEDQMTLHLQEQEQQLAAAAAAAAATAVVNQLPGGGSATATAAAAATCTAADNDEDSRSFCTPSERRIIALVAKYQYIVKYVALLNPGESAVRRGLHHALPCRLFDCSDLCCIFVE